MTTRYNSDFGAFEITPYPAQPQIAHCHGFFIVADARGKGLGSKLKLAQMELLTEQLYDYATCTVDATNAAQRRVLEKSGWECLAVFPNSRTGGSTELWGWSVSGEGGRFEPVERRADAGIVDY